MQRSFRTKLVQLLRRITARFTNRYRPELHYMRGPGPKSLGLTRHQMATNARGMTASLGNGGKARE